MNPRRWRRWSELTEAERVGLSTRQSLYLVLWSANGGLLVAAALRLDDRAQAAALVGGGSW